VYEEYFYDYDIRYYVSHYFRYRCPSPPTMYSDSIITTSMRHGATTMPVRQQKEIENKYPKVIQKTML